MIVDFFKSNKCLLLSKNIFMARRISWVGFGCFVNGFAQAGDQSPKYGDQDRPSRALSNALCISTSMFFQSG